MIVTIRLINMTWFCAENKLVVLDRGFGFEFRISEQKKTHHQFGTNSKIALC